MIIEHIKNEDKMFSNNCKHKTTIIKYHTGKYGFVGSIPINLGYWKKNRLGQDIFVSKIYNTKEEAEKELSAWEKIK